MVVKRKILIWAMVACVLIGTVWSQSILGAFPSKLGQNGRRKLYLTRVGQCTGQKNLPIYLPDLKIAAHNASCHVASGEVIFREDFPTGWKLSVGVKKCDDLRATMNCRPMLDNIANNDQCMLLRATDMLYSQYLRNISPKPRCPFRKGTYVVGETIVDDGMARFLPGPGNSYWEAKIMGHVSERLVLCFVMQFHVRPRKVKPRQN